MNTPVITTLCYIEDDGRYLMIHKNKKENDINAGKWLGLGGHKKEGETAARCLMREVKEEAGITLLSLNFRGIVHFVSPSDEEYMFIYVSDNFDGTPRLECDEGEIKWIPKSDIETLNLWEGDKIFLSILESSNQFFNLTLTYDDKGNLISSHDKQELYQDKHCISKHSDKIASCGKRALIVTGRNSAKRNGSLDDVIKALDEHGITYTVFNEVEENPSVETIMKGRDAGVNADADFVIGIGGGSPMDAAKAIALMLKNRGRGIDYLYENGNPSDALPVVCVPTTCGTGSEATAVSVLTRRSLGLKGSIPYKIMPEYGFSNIKYLRATDMQIIRNTAIDAFSHLVESYINSKATELSRAIAIEGFHKFRYVKEALLSKYTPNDDTLNNLLTMSTLAGMAIAIDGTGLPHALSYHLTLEGNIPHGPAVGYFIPGYLNAAGSLADLIFDVIKISDAEDLKELFMRLYHFERIDKDMIMRSINDVAGNQAKLDTAPFYAGKHLLKDMADFMC